MKTILVKSTKVYFVSLQLAAVSPIISMGIWMGCGEKPAVAGTLISLLWVLAIILLVKYIKNNQHRYELKADNLSLQLHNGKYIAWNEVMGVKATRRWLVLSNWPQPVLEIQPKHGNTIRINARYFDISLEQLVPQLIEFQKQGT
jgi:hypothetical protein